MAKHSEWPTSEDGRCPYTPDTPQSERWPEGPLWCETHSKPMTECHPDTPQSEEELLEDIGGDMTPEERAQLLQYMERKREDAKVHGSAVCESFSYDDMVWICECLRGGAAAYSRGLKDAARICDETDAYEDEHYGETTRGASAAAAAILAYAEKL